MTQTSFALRLLSIALLLPLAGCGHGSPDDEDSAPTQRGEVAVTTAAIRRQIFHDTIAAWGSAVGDPQRARAISLAHGGQVVALDVAAGQTVTRGQALLQVAPDPATRSAYQQARSALALAASELKRTEQLAAQRLATQSQLANARKALNDAQAALDAQRAQGGGSAREAIEAPADGIVTTLSVGLGERFAAGAPLFTFTPARALMAQLGVQPQDGPSLHAGMPVQLQRVYGSGDSTMTGTLRMIGQSVDAQSHLLNAQVELPADVGATLLAGAPLSAQIQTAAISAWAVPRSAVLHDDKGDYLFQLAGGKAKRIAVTVRSGDGDPIGVDGPLDAKAKVIVLGVYELQDGDAVRETKL